MLHCNLQGFGGLNYIIVHGIMFIPRVIVIKITNMAHLCNSADDSKKSITVWAKNKKSNFSHFRNYNSGSKHDNYTNDPIFLICSLSSIRWYISFLHFNTFKIQSHGVPHLHYVLVRKINIYKSKMTLSSLAIDFLFLHKIC